ncbi:MAG: TM2 domain-containing protein [Flavobacteriaceae bacterium]|nr:TM2 domain-containing protein [Flavobacteriaceae bacterium]
MQVVDENGNIISNQSSKRVVAGILAIILGSLGIHKFILGYTKEGVITLLITFVLGIITCGISIWVIGIITLIEGIIYLTKSDEDFIQIYQVNKKGWF